MQFGPDLRAGLEAEQTDTFAAESEGRDEESGVSVFARDRIANQRAGAIIDLGFFAAGLPGFVCRAACGRSG